ncbi:MAG: hypothetical protein CHACPFDD_00589 [Phycisphaerae bacterium]|nr:hypothetical protein [Phycisphaerae bacterium]
MVECGVTISPEQRERLAAAIHSHEFLHRILREIESALRVVFHSDEQMNWKLARQAAEQILIAEIVCRYRGDFDGIYHAVRRMENEGRPWAAAIRELAAGIHSYFTTPLGIIMRRDLFGDQAVFLSPEALDWYRKAAE